MHFPLFFILLVSTACNSALLPPPCESGKPVCCDGDSYVDEGIILGCDYYSEKNIKCDRRDMMHCCAYIAAGVGILCGSTAAKECPATGVESRKRHLLQRGLRGCPSSIKKSEGDLDYSVADVPLGLDSSDSSDMFLADETLPDLPADENLWGPTTYDDGSMTAFDDGSLTAFDGSSLTPFDDDGSITASLGGGGVLPMTSYGSGDDTSSLALLDDTSAGGLDYGSDYGSDSSNMFLYGRRKD